MSIQYKMLSQMDLEMRRQETVARHLSGMNVSGFKGEHLLSESFNGAMNDVKSGMGVKAGALKIDFDEGVINSTDRPLDFAIHGEKNVFFEVSNDRGDTFFTRNGNFKLTSTGEVVTNEGFDVEATGGRMRFSPEDSLEALQVRDDGSVYLAGQPPKEIARLKIVQIANLDKLERVSGSYFRLANKDIREAGEANKDSYQVLGRSLEGANVDPLIEMAGMMDSMRRFEMGQRFIRTLNGMSQKEYQTFA